MRPDSSSASRGSRDSTCTSSKRVWWRSLRSASSSRNITVSVRRIAVEQRDVLGLRREQRGCDAEHRGDPGTRGDQHVAPDVAGQVRHEPPLRRQHVERVTDLNLVDEVRRHRPAGDLADADPRRSPLRRADRVRAPLVGPVDLAPDRQRLAGPEDEVLGEVVGHVEGDRDAVVGQPPHLADLERVESRPGSLVLAHVAIPSSWLDRRPCARTPRAPPNPASTTPTVVDGRFASRAPRVRSPNRAQATSTVVDGRFGWA